MYVTVSTFVSSVGTLAFTPNIKDALPIRIDSNNNIYYNKTTRSVKSSNGTTTVFNDDIQLFVSEPNTYTNSSNNKPLFCSLIGSTEPKLYNLYYVSKNINVYLSMPPTSDKTKAFIFTLNQFNIS